MKLFLIRVNFWVIIFKLIFRVLEGFCESSRASVNIWWHYISSCNFDEFSTKNFLFSLSTAASQLTMWIQKKMYQKLAWTNVIPWLSWFSLGLLWFPRKVRNAKTDITNYTFIWGIAEWSRENKQPETALIGVVRMARNIHGRPFSPKRIAILTKNYYNHFSPLILVNTAFEKLCFIRFQKKFCKENIKRDFYFLRCNGCIRKLFN